MSVFIPLNGIQALSTPRAKCCGHWPVAEDIFRDHWDTSVSRGNVSSQANSPPTSGVCENAYLAEYRVVVTVGSGKDRPHYPYNTDIEKGQQDTDLRIIKRSNIKWQGARGREKGN